MPVTSPADDTVAANVLVDSQVASLLTLRLDPSENVAKAVSCNVWPTKSEPVPSALTPRLDTVGAGLEGVGADVPLPQALRRSAARARAARPVCWVARTRGLFGPRAFIVM